MILSLKSKGKLLLWLWSFTALFWWLLLFQPRNEKATSFVYWLPLLPQEKVHLIVKTVEGILFLANNLDRNHRIVIYKDSPNIATAVFKILSYFSGDQGTRWGLHMHPIQYPWHLGHVRGHAGSCEGPSNHKTASWGRIFQKCWWKSDFSL